jgi:hypothetical protein
MFGFVALCDTNPNREILLDYKEQWEKVFDKKNEFRQDPLDGRDIPTEDYYANPSVDR